MRQAIIDNFISMLIKLKLMDLEYPLEQILRNFGTPDKIIMSEVQLEQFTKAFGKKKI